VWSREFCRCRLVRFAVCRVSGFGARREQCARWACIWCGAPYCPKYRRRVLGGRAACRLDELIEQIADEHGWQIVAHEVVPDHVHQFVRVVPTDAPAGVVRAFKGRTARVLREEFPHLRNFAKVLWSPAYFAASVGYVSETTMRRYIEHQWDAVMAS
jgi:putative transposase